MEKQTGIDGERIEYLVKCIKQDEDLHLIVFGNMRDFNSSADAELARHERDVLCDKIYKRIRKNSCELVELLKKQFE